MEVPFNLTTTDICANRHGGNRESAEANESLGGEKVVQSFRVFTYLHERGESGATTEEVALALGLRLQSASARMSELKAAGIITPTAARRPTTSGRMAGVFKHRIHTTMAQVTP